MSKSGLADSPFFAPPPAKTEATPLSSAEAGNSIVENKDNKLPKPPTSNKTLSQAKIVKKKKDTENQASELLPKSENEDGMNESMHASNNASMQANKQTLIQESVIETIRKAVKDVGKDSATYRFTPEEKKALLELSFSYKIQGYKTSENELTRIAINFILEDQKQNGRNSVLQRVLDALSK